MADTHDIQHSIIEMQAKKSKLGAKKAALQLQLSEYKEMLKVVPQKHITHAEITNKKREAINEINQVEAELAELKIAIKKRQHLKDEVEASKVPNELPLRAEVIVLRDYYLKFAGDKTRVASMRAMAAEFAEALTKMVKKSKGI